MTSQNKRDGAGDPLESALDAYCEAWFAGNPPDPDQFCRDHSECGPELREKIAGFAFVAEGFSDEGPAAEAVAGRVLGDFRLIREIGRGGMATVYEAEQISLKRRVALKVLSPHLSLSMEAIQRFRREAQAASRQYHSGVVSIYAVGESGGTHFIAQELVEDGCTLADNLKEYREKEELTSAYYGEAAALIARVADALVHTHDSGVIHRDVKPSNVLLTKSGSPKVTDFGLARVEDALSLSRTGDFSGTPYYMSPEQARGSRSAIDHRTDIYSLGVTLFEALTLERPFEGETTREVIKNILFREPRNPCRVNPRIPRDLSTVCLKAIEKDPRQRYQTMAEFAEDLRRFLEKKPIIARPAGWVRRTVKFMSRHKLAALTTIAAVLAAVAVVTLALVVSAQRAANRRIAEKDFSPIEEALEWSDLRMYRMACDWCLRSTPKRPDWYLLCSVFDLHFGSLKKAVDHLEECIRLCAKQNEVEQEKDAHYLLGIAKLRLALEATDDPVKKRQLRAEGALEFEKAGDGCGSSGALVWREGRPSRGEEDSLPAPGIKLNRNHYLTHLYLGLLAFEGLYKGGEQPEFEKAVEHFQQVLKTRPNNVVALIFLGRVQYFLARFYNFMEMTDQAQLLLERALRYSGDSPYHMIDTTLGQICLLQGDGAAAIKHFERARELGKGDLHNHNAWRGLGQAFALQGEHEKALALFIEAKNIHPSDTHTNVAFADFLLNRGDFDKAMEYANEALKHNDPNPAVVVVNESRCAAAYLMCARIHLERGENNLAQGNLDKIYNVAHLSPRDMSLACFLITVVAEEAIRTEKERDDLVALASSLVGKALRQVEQDGRISPVCLSAKGASHYLEAEYEESIKSLIGAREERKRWREAVREFYWFEEARDLFLLAMSYYRLSLEAGDGREEKAKARRCFKEAEALSSRKGIPARYGDIFRRIRVLAMQVLPESARR
jgi:tetratricopeptide (TPR) repeat protein/tRNA A-37 threonylcarbamoyl transferase component Bud32